MLSRSKKIIGHPPDEIVEKLRWLENYPDSARLAKELFEMGRHLLISEHLIPTFMSSGAFLEYRQDSGKVCLSYERHFIGEDAMTFCIQDQVETKQCIIHRERGYDLFKELNSGYPERVVDRYGGSFAFIGALMKLNPSSISWLKSDMNGKESKTYHSL